MNQKLQDERSARIVKVNKLVHTIGQNGRRFFYDSRSDRYARMLMDNNGRLWWKDENTDRLIYLHYRYWCKGFSNGGTLQLLVEHLKEYVMTGQHLPIGVFGPWPDWYSAGDPWGYGRSIKTVYETAVSLGLLPEDITGDNDENSDCSDRE